MDANTEEVKKKTSVLKVVVKILRIGFVVGLLLIIGWMLLRGHYQNGTEGMKRYHFTEEAAALYEEGTLTVEKLAEINDKDLDRAFYIGNVHYTKELSQFQFMIRYNKYNESIASVIAERGLHCFSFVLMDDKGNCYTEYEYITDSKLMYGYYRIAFTGVDLTEAIELKVYVFVEGEEVSRDDAINNCVVWYSDIYREEYELSRAEKKSEKPSSSWQSGSVTVKIEETNGES